MSINTLFDNLFSSARWLALVIVIGVLLALAAIAGRSWLSARDASTKLSATVSAPRQVTQQDKQLKWGGNFDVDQYPVR